MNICWVLITKGCISFGGSEDSGWILVQVDRPGTQMKNRCLRKDEFCSVLRCQRASI